MKFTKRRKAYLRSRIRALRGRGLSWHEIGNALGISESSVYRLKDTTPVCNPAPVFFPIGTASPNQATRELAVRVMSFLTIDQTAWIFGVSPATLYRWRSLIQGNC